MFTEKNTYPFFLNWQYNEPHKTIKHTTIKLRELQQRFKQDICFFNLITITFIVYKDKLAGSILYLLTTSKLLV